MQTNYTFNPSVTITATPRTGTPEIFSIGDPTAAMVITNNSQGVAWVQIATSPSGLNPGPTRRGSLAIADGQSVLLLNSGQDTATWAALLLHVSGGSVDFTRGSVSSSMVFQCSDNQTVV